MNRQTNLELLRVLSMLFICCGHLGNWGNLSPYLISFNTIAPHAVDCFVVISGFFLIKSKFKTERILRTVTSTISLSFIVALILYSCNKIDITSLFKSLVPLYNYWFINKYIAVLLLSPFINKVCNSITKKQYQILIGSLLLLSSQLFNLFPLGELYGNGLSLLWMTTVYITGGYLRLHTPKFNYWGTATLILLAIYNICYIYFLGTIQLNNNSLITLTLAITTFMWFKSFTIPDKGFIPGIIKRIAPNTIAVYIIHSQQYVTTYISQVFHKFIGHIPDIFYLYLFASIVFLLSVIIDKIRLRVFQYSGIDNLIGKAATRLDKLYEE